MKPLDKFELREARQKFKTEKVRSLSPLFEQLIQIARDENFTDEETVASCAEAFSKLKASEFLIGCLFAASALSQNKNNEE